MATILVVDDEPMMRDALRQMLEREGFGVLTASDGKEGVSVCLARKPDLVISDIIMPGMDGLDMLAKLRQEAYKGPILAISGGDRVITPQFGLQSARLIGAAEVLEKPFTRQQLMDKVRALLKAHGARA